MSMSSDKDKEQQQQGIFAEEHPSTEDENENVTEEEPHVIDFDNDIEACTEDPAEDFELDDSKDELMHWHCKLGHTSFGVSLTMAHLRLVPARLADVKVPPKCLGCMCLKITRQNWRT